MEMIKTVDLHKSFGDLFHNVSVPFFYSLGGVPLDLTSALYFIKLKL